jgi:enediyne biosynthesis protein E3
MRTSRLVSWQTAACPVPAWEKMAGNSSGSAALGPQGQARPRGRISEELARRVGFARHCLEASTTFDRFGPLGRVSEALVAAGWHGVKVVGLSGWRPMRRQPLLRLLAGRIRRGDVDFAERGFPLAPTTDRAHLEYRGAAFVTGANAYAADPENPHASLQTVAADVRGFAYEGAAMVAAVADLVTALGRGRHLRTLLAGPGHSYRHVIHVGVGWGLDVLHWPHPQTVISLCPLLRWLALDGLAFHREFFHPEQTINSLGSLSPTPQNQVFVAGVGRALWFTQTADLSRITSVIVGTPLWCQSSMWSGVALASCYAGRTEPVLAEELRGCAEPHMDAVRQGLAFAGAAIQEHGLRLSGEQERLLLEFGVADAAELTSRAATGLTTLSGPVQNYELWRRRLRGSTMMPPALPAGAHDAQE